jgi:hypothetical protein
MARSAADGSRSERDLVIEWSAAPVWVLPADPADPADPAGVATGAPSRKPLAGVVTWIGRKSRRRRASLDGVPAGYLRGEYRDSRPDTGPKLVGHCSR